LVLRKKNQNLVMNKISIFVVVLVCNELLAAPMENNLQERDESKVANVFQMKNIGDRGRILVNDSQNLIHIRNKREYSRGRRHGHHHQKIRSRKNSLKRKKLHAHTIDHMTRKHRQHRHGSRSD
jgi:hypothetical protein